jgi:glycyl-tRNA synthetase beta chain
MAKDLLLEIGVEEIPASYMPPAISQLADAIGRKLADARLSHGDVAVHATPRRLAVVVTGVSEIQDDVEREAVGPPAKVAFKDDGTPTKAALGFAKTQGVEVSDLGVNETEKGDYVCVRVVEKGRSAAEVLPGCLAAVVASLSFPKTMRWGEEERFARPIRWLVAMLGGEALDLVFAGVEARAETYGHRFWSPGPHRLNGADDYLDVLERGSVIADVARRREMIRALADKAAGDRGGRVVKDEELLEEVAFLVEYPTVLTGRFDERFLDLPRDVVVAAMKGHQRYFAVESLDGDLLPFFICVANVPSDDIGSIRRGNERVLVSRLDDAEFYWREDTRSSLEDKVEALKSVTWLEGLGSLYEKSRRLEALAAYIGERVAAGDGSSATRAALLAKADLVTEMVRDGKEFTELQGIMGREYALQSGEPEAVATAIFEHYLPRFSGDALPSTEAGTILSIADRIDSIVGCFSAGLTPSGSQDPYALRRQSIGLVRLVDERKLDLSLKDLTRKAAQGYGLDDDSLVQSVLDFIRQRARNVFMEGGYSYDLVDAVLEASLDDLIGARRRLEALSHFRAAEDFEGLVIGARRVMNILKGQPEHSYKPGSLVEDASIALERARARAAADVEQALAAGDYDAAVRELLSLRRPIDDFFDNVMVMVDDEDVRAMRLGLLAATRRLFLAIADFAQVVLEGEYIEAN